MMDTVRLADVCQLAKRNLDPGKSPTKLFAHYSIPAYDDGCAPVIELGRAIKSAKTIVPSGAVLFSKLNPRISRVWRVNGDDGAPQICSTEFLPLLINKSQCNRDYLAWMLRAPAFMSKLQGRTAAATKSRERVSPDEVLAAFIPLPPLPEQRRIAHAIDAAMAEAEAAARAAEAQAADLDRLEFRMFEDAFPVRPLVLEKSEEAPEGWTWRLLTSVARLESGHTPSRRHPEWWGGDTPWIALPDIRAFDGSEAYETLETINDGGLANSSARLLPTETVCLSRTASVGFVTVMGRPMATSQDFVNWVCDDRFDPWFLAYALMASRSWIRSLASGATHKTIYMPTLKALRICVPDDVHVQVGIVDRIERCRAELRAAREAAAAQRSAVQALPAAILTAAFQGDL